MRKLVKIVSKKQMKLNTEKFHLLLTSSGPNTMKISNLYIKNYLQKELSGINFDYLKGINFAGENFGHFAGTYFRGWVTIKHVIRINFRGLENF